MSLPSPLAAYRRWRFHRSLHHVGIAAFKAGEQMRLLVLAAKDGQTTFTGLVETLAEAKDESPKKS